MQYFQELRTTSTYNRWIFLFAVCNWYSEHIICRFDFPLIHLFICSWRESLALITWSPLMVRLYDKERDRCALFFISVTPSIPPHTASFRKSCPALKTGGNYTEQWPGSMVQFKLYTCSVAGQQQCSPGFNSRASPAQNFYQWYGHRNRMCPQQVCKW